MNYYLELRKMADFFFLDRAFSNKKDNLDLLENFILFSQNIDEFNIIINLFKDKFENYTKDFIIEKIFDLDKSILLEDPDKIIWNENFDFPNFECITDSSFYTNFSFNFETKTINMISKLFIYFFLARYNGRFTKNELDKEIAIFERVKLWSYFINDFKNFFNYEEKSKYILSEEEKKEADFYKNTYFHMFLNEFKWEKYKVYFKNEYNEINDDGLDEKYLCNINIASHPYFFGGEITKELFTKNLINYGINSRKILSNYMYYIKKFSNIPLNMIDFSQFDFDTTDIKPLKPNFKYVKNKIISEEMINILRLKENILCEKKKFLNGEYAFYQILEINYGEYISKEDFEKEIKTVILSCYKKIDNSKKYEIDSIINYFKDFNIFLNLKITDFNQEIKERTEKFSESLNAFNFLGSFMQHYN